MSGPVLYKLRSICLLYHNHWCLHVSSKQWGCVCIRVSNTPHTELRFALIDSRIVFSRTVMSISEWLDVSETPSLPQILGLTCRGMQDTLFLKAPLPILQNFNTWLSHASFIRAPSRKHTEGTIYRSNQSVPFLRSFVMPAQKGRQFTARYG